MSNEYRHNHYVPEWYQKRFLMPGQRERALHYLDMKPGMFVDPRGVSHSKQAVRLLGPRRCFAEQDLYTAKLHGIDSTVIEQAFFGEIDRKGKRAVEYFADFAHPSVDGPAFNDMITYMSTQKLRTPKGLGWLREQFGDVGQDRLLAEMLRLRHLYATNWTESVWLIADASLSGTKFVVSDHPVTVYNRRCGPRSQWCRGSSDPDVWLNGTHTIFPLSYDKILILTNLSWVRNPYRNEIHPRPNPNPWRTAIIKFTEIQTLRHLSEQEVLEINFIIKSRALRYLGAAKEEWLYPEKQVSKSNWHDYGNGYLLMPDPRPLSGGGTIMWGGGPGLGGAMDAYGRVPGDPEFEKETNSSEDFAALQRFKGEFAYLFGPYRRGLSFEMMRLDNERDTDEYHQHHLSLWKRGRG